MSPKWLESDTGKIITGLLLVFIPIVSYTLLFPFYQNCLNLRFVMAIYALCGALLGAGVAYWFKDKIDTLIETFQLFIAAIFLGLVLLPLIATFLNRLIPLGEPVISNSHVVKVEQYFQSRFGELEEAKTIDGYFIFTILEEKVIRLTADSNLEITEYEPGSNLEITIHQGILGMRWADSNFQLAAEN